MKNKRNISGAICMAVFALVLILVGCPPPPTDNKGSAAPTKTPLGLSLNTMERMLTLSFDKNIKSVKDKGKIIVYKKSAGATEGATKIEQGKFTATAVNGKLVITLVDAIEAGDIFYVELQALAVTDEDDVANADTITSQELTIPNVFVTAFAIDKTAKTLTLTFNTGLSAKDDSKIEVHKGDTVLENSTYTIGAIGSSNASILVIMFTDAIGVSDTYTVKFQDGALTVGDAPSEAFEIGIDASSPAFAHPEDALRLDVALKTLTVSFNKRIASKTDGNIKVLKTPKASGVEAPLTITTDYTIIIDGAKMVITLEAAAELTVGDTYKVQFLADAVKGTNKIGNAKITTEAETVVPQPPTLRSKTFYHPTKQLAAIFRNAIAILSKSKIEVYKDGTKLTLDTDYTVTLVNKTEVEITLTTAPSKGQKYQVKFLAGAVEDAVHKTPSEAFEIEIDTSGPGFANPEDALSLDIASKTLTVSFNRIIASMTSVIIKVLKTPIDGRSTTLTIITDYSIAIDGAKVVIILKALNEGDTYKVQFPDGAVADTNNIGNIKAITTEAETVPIPPTLKYTTLVLNGNTLTATFRMAIAILSRSKIEVYKDSSKLTLTTDYTIALNADTTEMEITLTAAPSLNQKYQVKFLAGAVQDVVNNKPNGNLETKVFTIGSFIWRKATDAAAWPAREGHTSVVFDNKLWVLGGQVGNDEQNDVWYSEDGVTWTEATGAAAWPAREGHTSVVFDNKLWVMGGCSGTLPRNTNRSSCYRSATRYNDVWSSADGITWNEIRASANADDDSMWDIRSYHTSVVFDNKLWVIGGFAKNSTKWPDKKGMFMNDMWHSADGSVWTKVRTKTTPVWINYKGTAKGPSAPDQWSDERFIKEWKPKAGYKLWTTRYGHTSVVFKNKLWVIGGSSGTRNNYKFHRRFQPNKEYPWKTAYKHDVWSSSDGINWEERVEASWGIRRNHASVVFGNKLWVMGGRTKGSGKDRVSVNDVWSSADGAAWTQMADAGWWPNRDNHTIVEFKGRIWIMGGATKSGTGNWDKDNDKQYNDVWYYGSPLP